MKELKDYLHLYLGCECKITGCNQYMIEDGYEDGTWWLDAKLLHFCLIGFCKVVLVLRHLSDMKDDEETEFKATQSLQRATPVHQIMVRTWSTESFRWALSKHFDLFNLIEAGLAIDATTLKQLN